MNPKPTSLVEVLLPRPFDGGFDYLVPDGMAVVAGDWVSVPFGRQQMQGVVWGPARGDVPPEKCKALLRHYHETPPMTESLRQVIERLARYTLTPLGLALRLAMPHREWLEKLPQQEALSLREGASLAELSPKRRALAEWLLHHPRSTRHDLLQAGFSATMIKALVDAGVVIATQQRTLPPPDDFIFASPPALNAHQQQAAQMLRTMQGKGFGVMVLDGVTGSGKTEVYFDAIETILRDPDGGQVLVLLPEIALTVQWLGRFEARFGLRPHQWHSALPQAQRRNTWQAVAQGAARLVVGARSALFLPFAHLSLMVVDEEHEASYKQDEGIAYQARDMAVLRASIQQVPIVLASATPSMETIYNVHQGRYAQAVLPARHGAQPLPPIALIDLRQQKTDAGHWLSAPLREGLASTLAQGNQSLLFLNRRGYAPLLLCRGCGHRFQCASCSAWMVVHQHPNRLQCHHCDARQPYPSECPTCHADSDMLAACGPGVERLREEVQDLYPQARVAVLTSDDADIANTLAAMQARQIDIIIGTQMVAKGHHFPYLTLVGVIDADLGLTGGDLRAAERTYQLLHQVAGRAGRESAGGAMLQTVQPEHPVLQALAAWDRDGFIAEEMKQREAGGWPPFGRLAALLFDGPNEAQVALAARKIAQNAPRESGLHLLGPTPAPLSRLKGQFRYRLLVKAPRDMALQPLLREWLSGCHLPGAVRLKVDVDPYYFL